MSVKKIENLNKHENPATNINPFDVDTFLNDNWDKVKEVVDNNADELTVVEQDISDIKQEQATQNASIETLTQRLDEKDNQIAELEDKVSDLNNNQIYGKTSGEYVHLSDSAKMNCKIAVLGNSRQETRSGKNYFNTFVRYKAGDTPTINGIKFTFNKDGSITCDGTATADTTLNVSRTEQTISGTNKKLVALINGEYTVGKSPISFTAYDINWQNTKNIFLTEINKSMTTAMIDDVDYTTFRIIVYKDTIISNKTIYLQILDSSETDLTYEQYGAMPSIDYPSEIESVSSANVKVCNKNLFDNTINSVLYNACTKEIINSGIRLTTTKDGGDAMYHVFKLFDISNYTGKTFTLKSDWIINGTIKGLIGIGLCDENGNNRKQEFKTYVSGEAITYTIPNKLDVAKYICVWLYANFNGKSVIGNYIDYTNIQLELNETSTDYISHEEQNYPVDMQKPFRAINDVRDCFVLKEDGKWYERHKIIGKTITGEDIGTPLSNNRFPVLYEKIIPYIKPLEAKYYYTAIPENNIKSNIASPLINKSLTNLSAIEKGNYITTWNNTSYAFMLRIDKEMTKEEAVAYFNENPFYIEYIAETPIDIECTDQQTQQLQQLAKAKTYKNITNITTDTIAVLDVDYKRDLETIINNMQAQILAG